MSWLHPERLVLLLGVAALVGGYLALQRARRTAQDRWADAHLRPALAPSTAGSSLRRHLPVVLSLLGLTGLVVGLAQPARAETVPREQGVVVLAVDVSASMSATDVAPDRLQAAIAAAQTFVDEVPDTIHLGLVAFDGSARQVVVPTTDHDEVAAAIAGLTVGEGTATGDGITASLDAIRATLDPDLLASGEELPASVVLLSDGHATLGIPVGQATDDAVELGVPVTTIAFGTPAGTVHIQGETFRVPADPDTMRRVAEATGGTFHEAATAGQLTDVYEDISLSVGTTTEQREVTRGVLGVAFVALLAAGALNLAGGPRAI